MTQRLVIAIDCDDVLVPSAQNIIDDYNRRFGTHLTLDHMYKHASLETWGTSDDDVAINRVNEFLQTEEYGGLLPYSDAVKVIRELAGQHELHLITGRADFLGPVTRLMLDTHFGGCFASIEHTNYIVHSSSSAIKRTKGEVCTAIGAHILIDDHIDHGKNALAASVDRVMLFGEFPWNQSDELPSGMTRCKDWDAVALEIENYAAGE